MPPNIVFILADDLGYGDLGVYGQRHIHTPNLDSLALGGMRFTNFYSGSTVCAPSRASIMTGQHTGHLRIRGNGEFPLREEDRIIPEYLRQRGYVNGMVGKWGLGLQGTTGLPELKGWDYFAGHLHHIEGHQQLIDSVWEMRNGTSVKTGLPDGSFANEYFTSRALEFIRQNTHRPFFLYVSYTLPHAGLVAPQQYMDRYLDSNDQSVFPDESAWTQSWYYKQEFPKAAYAAMVTEMDDYVGKIMQTLKDQGLDENTLVLFASDNGTHIEGGRTRQDVEMFQSSGPLRGTKRDLYEGGIRVPFIARWPGKVPFGTVNHTPGAFWDLLATFTDAAGMQAPGQDGISLLPALLQQPEGGSRRAFYWEFNEGGFKQAIRYGNWKAIRFYDGARPSRTELYNLDYDQAEQENLAGKYPSLVRVLEAMMDASRVSGAIPNFEPR